MWPGTGHEPLVTGGEPVAWISQRVVEEARALMDGLRQDWGLWTGEMRLTPRPGTERAGPA